jgi:hypothetical protein
MDLYWIVFPGKEYGAYGPYIDLRQALELARALEGVLVTVHGSIHSGQ